MTITKKGISLIVCAFALAWGLCAVAWLAGVRSGSPWFLALAIAVMFTPLASALLVTRRERTRLDLRLAVRFRMGWKGFLLAWLAFPAAVVIAFGLALLLPGVGYDPSMTALIDRLTAGMPVDKVEELRRAASTSTFPPFLIALLEGLLAGLTVNAVAAFGEEAGWRGILLRELTGSGFWGASLFTGAVWGLWHAPLILQGHNYPAHPVAGVFMMIGWCSLLAPLFTYIRLKTGSTVAAAVAHGTLNGCAGAAVMALSGGSDLTVGITGLAGFAALGIVLLVLWLVDRRSPEPIMSRAIAGV